MASADRLIEVFTEAKARPAGAERERFLAEACRDEPALNAQVLGLLQAHESAGDFLKHTQLISPAAMLTEKPGDKIGRYKLLQQIGEGGCGVVYMAEQEEPVRRRVALKVIKLGMDTKQVIARFEAERQALALMDHPHIAKVLDAGATDTGRPYFVMELVRGSKITDYCDQNNLTTAERLKLFIQVCQAVQHAHQKGIIHRDIKPSNILVTISEPGSPGWPKVIDFGIAKATTGQHLTDKTVFTAFEQFIGTPAYMSPEQAMMTSLDIDTRSDIYSLGVLLYELLTGKTPFDAKELFAAGLDEMRRTIREVEPVKPSTRLTQELARAALKMGSAGVSPAESDVAPDFSPSNLESHGKDQPNEVLVATPRIARETRELPEHVRALMHLLRGDLDWIVMKCLEKDRTRRYETANGLAADIARHLSNEPIVSRPPSRLYQFQKSIQRNKLAFGGVTAVLVASVVGATFSTWQAIRAKRAENAQSHLLQEALKARAEETIQRKNAEAARENEARQRELIQAAYTLLAEALSGVGVSNQFSPDGTKLVTLSGVGSVSIWNTRLGKMIGEPLQSTNQITAALFTQDGDRVITVSKGGVVQILDANTGTPLKGFPFPRYPEEAIRRREQGTVVLRVSVDDYGNPASVQVEKSSGIPTLDTNALAIIKSQWVFPKGKPGVMLIPIVFRLE